MQQMIFYLTLQIKLSDINKTYIDISNELLDKVCLIWTIYKSYVSVFLMGVDVDYTSITAEPLHPTKILFSGNLFNICFDMGMVYFDLWGYVGC